MLFQSRRTKVFAAALISIGIMSAVLKFLGNNPPPAAAFSLSEYWHLGPIENMISPDSGQTSRHWNSIEINHSSTESIGINRQYSISGLFNYDVLNYHFFVWNGLVGRDGQIQSTENWQKQLPITPSQAWHVSEQTIRIGIIVNSKSICPTDFQIRRTEALVEALSRKFGIQPESIYYTYKKQ